jgi:hypothetical protein
MRDRIIALIKEIKLMQELTDLEWANPIDCTESSFIIDQDEECEVSYVDQDDEEQIAQLDEISSIVLLGKLVLYPSQDGLLVFDIDNYEGDPTDLDNL